MVGLLLFVGTLLGETEGLKDGSLDVVGWKLGRPVGLCDGVIMTLFSFDGASDDGFPDGKLDCDGPVDRVGTTVGIIE